MLFGTGFDRRGELLDLGLQTGLVQKAGSWFSIAEFPGSKGMASEWPILMGQGRDKVRGVRVRVGPSHEVRTAAERGREVPAVIALERRNGRAAQRTSPGMRTIQEALHG